MYKVGVGLKKVSILFHVFFNYNLQNCNNNTAITHCYNIVEVGGGTYGENIAN